MTSGAFRVDLDELAGVVTSLARRQRSLEALAARLAGDVRRLQEEWDGVAAEAHAAAQAEWDAGCAAMREALADLRAAAAAAGDHYDGAVAANVAMWRELA